MDVSIIIPIHNPNKKILNKSLETLKKQKFNGKIEIIRIEKNLGLAASLNYGIKKAKYDIIVSLHQDCIPGDENWIQNLVNPLKDKDIIAGVSNVELPESLWKNFDLFTKSLIIKERGVITPLLDEKGCAYRKSILERIGMFNEKDFRTAGEDFDLYIKIKNYGKIAYPNCKIIHMHHTNINKRLRKNYQNANGYGALVAIHGKKMPRWWTGLIKGIPIVGLLFSLINYPIFRYPISFIIYLLIAPIDHLLYIYGFWKGFLMKRQTV